MCKLKKNQFLYFTTTKRLEKIVKSSNNKDTGFIKTFYELQKREKEYSVKHIINCIKDESIILYEESVMTEDKIKELSIT